MGAESSGKSLLYEQISRTAKALANGKRLELLDLLAQGERTVEALARTAGLGTTTTSAHLQSLKHGGMVATRRQGTRVYYRLAGDDVADLFARLSRVAVAHLADVNMTASALLDGDADVVTREELLRRATAGEITVVDVRPREEYEAGHIPGAVTIPLAELVDRLTELPADIDIVAYCRGAFCLLAPEAIQKLTSHGRHARRLIEGMLEWRLAGLPVETEREPRHS